MAVLIRAQELTKTYGIQTLFEGLNISIEDNERLGIIGPNGVGKSTLMKILTGLETQDEGEVVLRKNLRVAYVPQMQSFDPEHSLLQVVEAAAAAAGMSEEEQLGAANIILGKIGFTDPEQLSGTLSGGWLKRLTLACGLVANPDVALFDEPTNHLDTLGVLWLEGLLTGASFAWVLITHDRYFLNRTATRVAELNPIFPDGVFSVDGNYAEHVRRRKEFMEAQQQYLESLTGKVKRETEWLRAGVKARTTKAKYRIGSANGLIDELDEMRSRTRTREVDVSFSASERQTRKLVEAKGIDKTLGDRVIARKLDILLGPGKRLSLLGTNGTGKTTIMRMLLKELEPDAGSVLHAPNLQAVYFDQDRSQLDPTMTLQEALSPTGGDSVVFQGRETHILSWARRFKFGRDQLSIPVGRLSGGEQARLLIARLMLVPADVLMLDEPTNDLDIPTLEILEESLNSFPGAVVLVTHDRYMLEKVCNAHLGLDGKGNAENYGDFAQWERELREGDKPKKPVAAAPSAKPKERERPVKKLSYKEQREWENMEATILEAEEKMEACSKAAEDPSIASNGARLMEAHATHAAAEAEVARLYDRWTELGEKVEALNQ